MSGRQRNSVQILWKSFTSLFHYSPFYLNLLRLTKTIAFFRFFSFLQSTLCRLFRGLPFPKAIFRLWILFMEQNQIPIISWCVKYPYHKSKSWPFSAKHASTLELFLAGLTCISLQILPGIPLLYLSMGFSSPIQYLRLIIRHFVHVPTITGILALPCFTR